MWLDEHGPDVVAVERVFSQHNVGTVMGTAQAAGLAMVAAARRGVPVALHTPTEVKAAVTGSGRADKAQVATMVTRILGLDEAPRPADAADALALAICHLWRPAGSRCGRGRRRRLRRGDARPSGAGPRPRRLPHAAEAARRARPAAVPSPAAVTRRLDEQVFVQDGRECR